MAGSGFRFGNGAFGQLGLSRVLSGEACMKSKSVCASARFRNGATILRPWIAPTMIAAFLVASFWCVSSTRAADPPNARKTPWTLEDAQAQLRLYRRDAYLQYVVLMLQRQSGVEGNSDETTMPFAGRNPGRGAGVDLFSLFSGSSAVQESLQLDTMRGEHDRFERPLRGTPGRRIGSRSAQHESHARGSDRSD